MTHRPKGVRRWLADTNSTQIGHRYAASIGIAAAFGLAAAILLLWELATPRPDVVDGSRFGAILTLHGMTMVFLVLIPLFPAVLGNLLIPRAVGSPAMAFPRLNLLGWYLYVLGALAVALGSEFGGYQGGWKMNLPPEIGSEPAYGVMLTGLLAVAVSTMFMNLAQIRTILSTRHRAITIAAVPLFIWFFLFGSVVQLLALPFRLWHLALQFDTSLARYLMLPFGEIDPTTVKRQLFWMYANPAILSVMLPAVGVACAAVGTHLTKGQLPKRAFIMSGVALSLLSLVSWGQHMLTAADGQLLALFGSLYGLLTIIPATLFFAMLLRGWLQAKPTHSAVNVGLFGQVTTFGVLVLSGIALATPSVGVHLHNTYTTVGHVHYGAVGIGLMGFVAGVSHWWPLLSHRKLRGKSTRLWMYGMVVGLHASFIPLLMVGLQGAPRAYHDYARDTQTAHLIAAGGGVILIMSLFGWIVHVWRGGRTALTAAEHLELPSTVSERA